MHANLPYTLNWGASAAKYFVFFSWDFPLVYLKARALIFVCEQRILVLEFKNVKCFFLIDLVLVLQDQEC